MAELRRELRDRLARQESMSLLRDRLRAAPELRYLFFELTDGCNLRCRHCGSRCGPGEAGFLDADKLLETAASAAAWEPRVHIVLTGGEPLLHPEFSRIVRRLGELGAYWSLVTNAVLVEEKTAALMRENGIYSVSVSLDGDETEHDRLRCSPTAYARTMRGISFLRAAGIPLQITTVVTKRTADKLERLEETVRGTGAASWKLVNVEPIGRAREDETLLLDRDALFRLLDFIRARRKAAGEDGSSLRVTYGCSHLLPLLYEEEVRTGPFLCGAGILIAGIRCSGDIVGCLDIEPRPELVQGNVYRDDFLRVWRERYQPFRRDRTGDSSVCRSCALRQICGGDSLHAWDFDRHAPRMCLMRLP